MLASIVQRRPVMLVSALEVGSLILLGLHSLVLLVIIVVRISLLQQGQLLCKTEPLAVDPGPQLLWRTLKHNCDYSSMQIRIVLLIQIPLNGIRRQVLRLLGDSARSRQIELPVPAILHLLLLLLMLLALALLPCNRWQILIRRTIIMELWLRKTA